MSFDLPEHANRIAPAREGLIRMCEAIKSGKDPFEQFVAKGRAAVDACLKNNLARPGRIFACGVSRAGYCVLRLAAADPRVAGVAAFAPVTDWRVVREFVEVRSRSDAAALALANYAARLAGRPVYLAIGNQDRRVGTDCCTRFATRLFEEESRLGLGHGQACLHVVDDSCGVTAKVSSTAGSAAMWPSAGSANRPVTVRLPTGIGKSEIFIATRAGAGLAVARTVTVVVCDSGPVAGDPAGANKIESSMTAGQIIGIKFLSLSCLESQVVVSPSIRSRRPVSPARGLAPKFSIRRE